MNGLLEAVASNCLVALVLAGVVAAIARFRVNPNLIHVLWLMVLLKLFTPPLLWIGLPWPEPAVEPPVEEIAIELEPRLLLPAPPMPAPPREPAQTPAWSWNGILLAVWIVGIAGILAMTILRILCFRKLLQQAEPAPRELEDLAEALARRLGVRRLPRLLLLPVRITPAVWSLCGRPRILLPAQLAAEMDPAQLETILAHELAHIRRGDHLVRILELAVTTVFWWNPLVWWVRRNLREMEEQCCDALVLETLPDSARRYAIALIETVEFLSQQTGRLPIGATAAQPAITLTRRIEMLKHGSHVRRLSVRGLAAMLAVLIVPMTLAFAQEEPTATELKTIVYRLGDLNAKQVEQDIRKQVAPKEWAKAGGAYSLKRTKNNRLIITASLVVHEQVMLLLKLRQLERQQQAVRKQLQATIDDYAMDVAELALDTDAAVARVWDLERSSQCKQCHENDSVWLDLGALGKAHAKDGKLYHSLMGLSVLPLEKEKSDGKAHDLAKTTDDAVWLRRVDLDLLGTLPGAKEAESFLKDTSPDKKARKIVELRKTLESRESAAGNRKEWLERTEKAAGNGKDWEFDDHDANALRIETESGDHRYELLFSGGGTLEKAHSGTDEVIFFLRGGKLYKRVLLAEGRKEADVKKKDGWLILPVETSDADLRLGIHGEKSKVRGAEQLRQYQKARAAMNESLKKWREIKAQEAKSADFSEREAKLRKEFFQHRETAKRYLRELEELSN